jgi:short-subunit dehydrogenase
MTVEVRGKTVVITGASSGIGEAAAMLLARAGARVCLVARRQDELARVKAAIEAAGGRAWAYPADLSKEAEVDACAGAILAEHPQVDVLVNNAARSIRRLVSDSLDRFHDYQRTMQLNYFGPLRLTLRLLPGWLARGQGHVVNVSSYSTMLTVPRFSAYVASKSALEGFSRSLAAELVGRDIYVTVINYPLVKTPMTAPTRGYKYLKQMEPEQAARWILKAIERRPARVAGFVQAAWGVLLAAFPTFMTAYTGRLMLRRARKLQARVERDAQQGIGDG